MTWNGRVGPSRTPIPIEALTPPPDQRSTFAPQAGGSSSSAAPGELLEGVRRALRRLHYGRRTEQACLGWSERFLEHYRGRAPAEMGADEVRVFLSHLAVNQHVTASTQNQALCALLFLYRHAVGRAIGSLEGIERAKAPKRLPVVLTRNEIRGHRGDERRASARAPTALRHGDASG